MLTIELDSDPYYERTVTLDNALYTFVFRYIELESAWYLDINGTTDTTVVVHGIKLVPGVDLVEPYGLLGFGELWLVDLGGQNREPGYDNISTEFVLYYE
jgi:hypothetical protein